MQKPPVPELTETALFLDIDGTLVEHAAHPDAVIVPPALPGILGDLNRKLDGAVAFVTGRNLAMVERLFGQTGLAAAGTFGIERMLGDELESGHEAAAAVTPVFTELEKRFSQTKGVYFEYKGPVLAVHTRAAPEALPAVIAACRNTLTRLPAGYRLLEGHAGAEFLPEGATKSAAIAWFMSRPPFRGRIPVFLGDDTSDEIGFEWTNRNSGISVRIGPEIQTQAHHTLRTVTDVHDWLTRLARSG
ncbi:trehalose-phosphatase [Roseinatronobacter sp. HJB301]|uniref:Trehalose 6-phosphate phosphatase n=2 Tax=Roseinatronobacter alkalisoli TaxID=3028235 RepID=A0ABT5TB79_9RHOB|nr:trehalose-phosphatase [Roseinatronobacter sp. HJB301]